MKISLLAFFLIISAGVRYSFSGSSQKPMDLRPPVQKNVNLKKINNGALIRLENSWIKKCDLYLSAPLEDGSNSLLIILKKNEDLKLTEIPDKETFFIIKVFDIKSGGLVTNKPFYISRKNFLEDQEFFVLNVEFSRILRADFLDKNKFEITSQ